MVIDEQAVGDGGERRRRGGILCLRLPRPTEPHRLRPAVLPASPTAAVTSGRNGTGGNYNNNNNNNNMNKLSAEVREVAKKHK